MKIVNASCGISFIAVLVNLWLETYSSYNRNLLFFWPAVGELVGTKVVIIPKKESMFYWSMAKQKKHPIAARWNEGEFATIRLH